VSRFGVHVAGYGGESRAEKSLVQLFKDGSLAIGFVLFENTNAMDFGYDFTKSKTIPWMAVENRLFTSIGQAVNILKKLEVQQPAFLRLVIPGLKGYGMAFDPSNWIQHHPVDADLIETSPSLVASFDLAATEIARPLLEEFWQYLGVWHSPSYDEKGEFVRKR